MEGVPREKGGRIARVPFSANGCRQRANQKCKREKKKAGLAGLGSVDNLKI
jgi:hypothetical protein